MTARENYEDNARIVVRQLLPQWPPEAQEALVFLVVDFLLSMDAIAAGV